MRSWSRSLVSDQVESHRYPCVFVGSDGTFLRRSNFSRRAMRPAADGTNHLPRPRIAVPPAAPQLTFHGFRHSHKTWLIADHIPDVAQARRLGHRIPDKIEHIYSHVAAELETRILDCLQRRWIDALSTATAIREGLRCRPARRVARTLGSRRCSRPEWRRSGRC